MTTGLLLSLRLHGREFQDLAMLSSFTDDRPPSRRSLPISSDPIEVSRAMQPLKPMSNEKQLDFGVKVKVLTARAGQVEYERAAVCAVSRAWSRRRCIVQVQTP